MITSTPAGHGSDVRSRRRGFTIVEAMAAITVMSALASIALVLILDTVDDAMDATSSAQLHEELAVAVDRASRELRKIDLDAGVVGVAPDIENVTASSIQ